jgi:hypothetical protein
MAGDLDEVLYATVRRWLAERWSRRDRRGI